VKVGNLSKIGARRIIRLNQNGHVGTCPPPAAQYILRTLPMEMSSVSHIFSVTKRTLITLSTSINLVTDIPLWYIIS
jgi:hypothetical protein